MIRFRDKEICCITESEMDWQLMTDYFLDKFTYKYCMTEKELDFQQALNDFLNYTDEKIYILDEDGKYIGSVIYNSLFGNCPDNAIKKECVELQENKKIWVIKDCVSLDKDIWENGRKYFKLHPDDLLPVVDQEHRLICFAWNDEEANREIRMLDELLKCRGGVLDFKDIYPEADCVTVYGCNELSYSFVQYLKEIGMPVNVTGELWDVFGEWEQIEIPSHKNFIVYGEGDRRGLAGEQCECKSVSAEFECINKIYEKNILRGIIADTDGSFQDVINRIKGKHIVLIGETGASFDAYDLLLGHGIDICCFCSDKLSEHGKRFFGKMVLNYTEVLKSVKNPVFIESSSRYSAWGFGGVDAFHYQGFKRNEHFFLLQDYVEIPHNGMMNILNHAMEQNKQKLVLIGDFWLCLKLSKVIEEQNNLIKGQVVYLDVLEEHKEKKAGMIWVCKDELPKECICLMLLPEYVGCVDREFADKNYINGYPYRISLKAKYLQKAIEANIQDVIDYSVENKVFMDKSELAVSRTDSLFKVKKIVLGSIEGHSGNVFFKGILDNHPGILMMNYSYLSDNLFSICIRLSMEKKENILKQFWKFYDSEIEHYNFSNQDNWGKSERNKFNQNMEKMLVMQERFSSQDLFVMIHIAYAGVTRKIEKNSLDLIIYWGPHLISRKKFEEYAVWLGDREKRGCIVNVVRNAYARCGSRIRGWGKEGKMNSGRIEFFHKLSDIQDKKKNYDGWDRLTVRFEDLKCHPQKELMRICEKFEIQWSETLMETTLNGRQEFWGKISGFDLEPVYRTYEQYFSAFDVMRIMLIYGPWQKQNGYPYVNSLDFSRKELQDMFGKAFRFEANQGYADAVNREKWMIEQISYYLWVVRREEIMKSAGTED